MDVPVCLTIHLGRFSCFLFGAITNEAAMNSLVKKTKNTTKWVALLFPFEMYIFSLNLIFLLIL